MQDKHDQIKSNDMNTEYKSREIRSTHIESNTGKRLNTKTR